jgi:hypothetical protein
MRRYFSNGTPLKGGQKKLDVDGDGKITGKDFAMLKNKKKNTTAKKQPSKRMKAIGVA